MPSLSPAAILDALRPVHDPELQRSLVELNMIRNVVVEGSSVRFTLVLTTPACPLREFIVDECKSAIRALPGAADITDIQVAVTAETPQAVGLPDRQAIPGVRNVIAVTSGKGGVGKSTVTANIAAALAQTGAKVGVLDADIYGPNMPLMLGLEGQVLHSDKDSAGNDRIYPVFNHGIKLVSMSFLLRPDQPVVWRGPMLNGIIRQFLYQTVWGELDYLIVDLPPGTGDAQLTLAQAVPIAGVVVVTTPQTVALLDARKGLKMFEQLRIPVLGIVENMSYFIPPDLPDRQYDIFGSGGGEKTAQELGVALLGRVPLEIEVREGGDKGLPIVVSQPESASAVALVAIAKAVAAKASVLALSGY